MSTRIEEWKQAVVVAVVSGDTLCVKYFDFPNNYAIVRLAHGKCPKFGFVENSENEEPYGDLSWIHMISLCKLKRIIVSFPPIIKETGFFEMPLLGSLPVTYNEVKVYSSEEDLLSNMLIEGLAELIDTCSDDYQNQLQRIAKQRSSNIWSSFIRSNSAYMTNPKQIYEISEFDTYVYKIDTNCITGHYIPDENIRFDMVIAGIYIPPLNHEMNREVSSFLAEISLSKKARVRVLYMNQENVLFGSIIIGSQDLATMLLKKGYAIINSLTVQYRSDFREITNTECSSKLKGIGIWKNITPNSQPIDFVGRVVEIVSSTELMIHRENDENEQVYIINGVYCGAYSVFGKSEAGGFEAFHFLREKCLGEIVKVHIDDIVSDQIYSTIWVQEKSINEMMIENRIGMYISLGFIQKSCVDDALRIHARNPIHDRAISVRTLMGDDLIDYCKSIHRSFDAFIVKVVSPSSVIIEVLSSRIQFTVYLCQNQKRYCNIFDYNKAISLFRRSLLYKQVSVSIDKIETTEMIVYCFFSINGNIIDFNMTSPIPKSPSSSVLYRKNNSPIEVVVTSILSPSILSFQIVPPYNNTRSKLQPLKSPKKGDNAILFRNNITYRVIIQQIGCPIQVSVCDYGTITNSFIDELFQYPEEIIAQPPKGLIARIAFVDFFDGYDSHIIMKYLQSMLISFDHFFLHVIHDDDIPEVLITINKDLLSMCVQYVMLKDGTVKLKPYPLLNESLTKVFELLVEGENQGRTSQMGYWSKDY